MTSPGEDGLGDLLAQMQSLQGQLAAAQADAGEQIVEGGAGGGAVRVTATGELDFRSVTIDPSVVDPADVSLLEDLVLAALHDVVAKIEAVRQEAMGSAVSGMLGGLFGGLGDDLNGLDDEDDDEDDEEPGGPAHVEQGDGGRATPGPAAPQA